MSLRPLADELQTLIERPAAALGFLLSIDWGDGLVSRLSTYGAIEFDGEEWLGAGLSVGDLDATGIPGKIVIFDEVGDFRTLFLANGIRDRALNLWQVYLDDEGEAVGELIFEGVADAGSWAKGQLTITAGRGQSAAIFTPRMRIGPAVGANFTATDGETLTWSGQKITLETR